MCDESDEHPRRHEDLPHPQTQMWYAWAGGRHPVEHFYCHPYAQAPPPPPPSRQQRSWATDESPPDRGGLRDFLGLVWRCNKERGFYVSPWLLMHLCVIKHENDYLCVQRQDEWPLRGKPRRKVCVCASIYMAKVHFFEVGEYQCLKKTPEERAGKKNHETINNIFITEPPLPILPFHPLSCPSISSLNTFFHYLSHRSRMMAFGDS